MMDIEEYSKYMKKCEMLGIIDFEFKVINEEVILERYIPNQEKYRRIIIPDFISKVGFKKFNEINQDLTIIWKNNKCTDLNALFFNYEGSELDLSKMDTSNVKFMKYMISNTRRLKKLNIKYIDTYNVSSMLGMFMYSSIETLDLSSFDTSNVKDMAYMFSDCINLKELNIGSFDTSNVKSMTYLFSNCVNLKELDLSNFDTSNVADMRCMFGCCKDLKKLDISNFDTSSVTYIENMFEECNKLKAIITNKKTKQWLEKYKEEIRLNRECKIIVK